jgi:hypothetical protein
MYDEEEGEELTCRDCRAQFVFSPGEQRLFEGRGFTPPVRCKQCRLVKAERRRTEAGSYEWARR